MEERYTGELRISDADRDQISNVLSEHAAEGRLTLDELDQRVGTLLAAQTRAQAAAVVADLPALVPRAEHHFHLGHEHDHEVPSLPEWLTGDALAAIEPAPASLVSTSAPAASSVSPHEARAAARKRAKLRQDENAIGHTFQATRRAISVEREKVTAGGGDAAELARLEQRLRDAEQVAGAARQALVAGNRAEVQRQLAHLRTLGA